MLLSSLHTLLLKLLFFWFKNEFFPEASNLAKFSHSASSSNQSGLQGRFFVDKFFMLCFQGFLLLDSLAVQDSQAEL